MIAAKAKRILWSMLKLGAAVGLIGWMAASGKLEISKLSILFTRYDVFTANILIWFFVSVMLGSLRWYVLLHGIGLLPTYLRTCQLQLIGFFFNSAMPGAVGGDLIKAYFIYREQGSQQRTPALMSILADRLTGLFGLFIIGLVAISFDFGTYFDDRLMAPLVWFVVGMTAVFCVATTSVLIDYNNDPFDRLLRRGVPGFSLLLKLYSAIRLYRHEKKYLVYAMLLTFTMQGVSLVYFVFLAKILAVGDVQFGKVAAIFPIGVTATAIPFAPGGLGIGHAAFDNLFHRIQLAGGATVFNVFCLGQLALNLLGAIPYLMTRSNVPSEATLRAD